MEDWVVGRSLNEAPGMTAPVLALLVIDVRALRLVARMFDRERLVTGAKAIRS